MKKYTKNLIILAMFGLFVLSFGTAKAQNLYSTNGAFPGATSVILSASINPNGNPTTGWFQISTNSAMNYPTETNHVYVGSSRSETSFTDTINGLSPNTVYYYRALANNGYSTTKGNILSFSTKSYNDVSSVNYMNTSYNNATVYTNPTVYSNNNAYQYNGTSEIVNITATGAIMNAVFTNPNGSPAQGFFEWGTTTSFGNVTETINLGTNYSSPFSGTLSGLTPNTKYYFRAVVLQNGQTYRGVTKSFVTYSSTSINTGVINTNYQNPTIITEQPNTVSTLKVIDGNNTLTANALFGVNFLPTNIFGWLILLFVILAIVWALRKLSEPTYIIQK